MTKIQLKRSSALLSGSARVPAANQLDYGELAINYSSTDPQLFYKDSGGNVVSFFEPYAPLSGATFTGDCTFNTDVDFDGAVTIQGDSTNGSGKLTLTCEQNTHAVNIKAPAHSASANYTLTLPSSTGSSGEVLSTDGSGGLSWAYAAMSTADKSKLDGIAAGAEVNVNADWNATSGDAEILNKPTIPTNNNQLTNGAGYITSADGGNAGTLDGIDSSSFLRSDAADTFTQKLTGGLSVGAMAFDLATNDNYASMRVIQNKNSSGDGMYLGFQNGNNGVTRIFGGGAGTGGIEVRGSGTTDVKINGNTAWHAGNDGAGSGLDADTLDGLDSSSFLRSDSNDSFTGGSLTISTAITGGSVITASSAVLQVNGFQRTGSIYLHEGTTPAGTNSLILSNGSGILYWDNNKIWHAGNDGAGSGLDADTVDGYHFLQTQGISAVGNFGQWQAHGAYASGFNASVSYWGWNYVQGNTNAPNTTSSQWYRNRVSLGDAYGLNYSSGHYWLEMAYPRDNRNSAGHMWVRTCENGSVGSWEQVGSRIIGDLIATGDVTANSDMRSPIYYDSNNTNYYIDPASSSSFNTASFAGKVDFEGDAAIQGGSGYGIFKGYTGNHNHMMVSRGSVTGSTASPTFTGAHEMTFCEYLNSDSYGFVFKRTDTGTYTEVCRITRVGLTHTGNITAYSDLRLKENIEVIPNALSKVKTLRGVTYNRKDFTNKNRQAGVIAQEVEKVLPEVVQINDEGIKSVAYGNMIGLVVEAIKELSDKVNRIEQVIDSV